MHQQKVMPWAVLNDSRVSTHVETRLSLSTPHCIDVYELSDASDWVVTCDLVSGRSDPVGRVYVSAEHLLSSGDCSQSHTCLCILCTCIDSVTYLFEETNTKV